MNGENMKKLFYSVLLVSLVTLSATGILYATFLPSPDGTVVYIDRDEYGVPHVHAETEFGMFFGQGFATARDRLMQMNSHRLAAQGRLAEWMGPDKLESDQHAKLFGYTHEERLARYAAMDQESRDMLIAYSAGVNAYMDSMEVNPLLYSPAGTILYDIDRWTPLSSMIIGEYNGIFAGSQGGWELTRLEELELMGEDWFEENRPINDPTAPTTIHDGAQATEREWSYSGIEVNPEIAREWEDRHQRVIETREELNLLTSYGSFAALICEEKSESGAAMLLGCPQVGEPTYDSPAQVMEIELSCPTMHIAGVTSSGSPGIFIGRNDYFAWSITSGHTDNSDIFIETMMDETPSYYRYNDEWLEFEVYTDTIYVYDFPTIYTHYRTIHGPVVSFDYENHQAFSLKTTVWDPEYVDYGWSRDVWTATSVEEVEEHLWRVPSSINLFYADYEGNVRYWHLGWYNDRTDGIDPRLPHNGDGSEEWGGIIPFEDLPMAGDMDQDYFVNWNNKPASWWNNGDNIPWVGDNHVTLMDNYVAPITPFNFENLKRIPQEILDHGTYQQAIEWTEEVNQENILPPGQSDFISLLGIPDPHRNDQWDLHLDWDYKLFRFGEEFTFPVSIDVDPWIEPVVIPGDGGNIVFDITLSNNTGQTLNFGEVWTEVILSSGDVLGPFNRTPVGLAPGEIIELTAIQRVHAVIPGGVYTYAVRAGIDGSIIMASDQFEVIKLPDAMAVSGQNSSELWNDLDWNYGYLDELTADADQTEMPFSFELMSIYPNPFNPSTRIVFALTQPAKLKMTVYNINGQEVALLADNIFTSGQHELIFDATNLASGIYFIHAETQNGKKTVRKIVMTH